MFKNLAAKYGNTGRTESQGIQTKTFNIMLACYPHPESDKQPKGEYADVSLDDCRYDFWERMTPEII